jgi:hypothetical protein
MKTKILGAAALVAAGCLGIAPAQANLITNGGFETGDFTGWITDAVSYPMYTVTSPVHGGTYAAQIAGYSYGPDLLAQEVVDTNGQNYQLSFWRYQQNEGLQTFLDVTWDGTTVFFENNPGSGDLPYQQFTATVTGTGIDTLVFSSANDPGWTYLDDVSLTPLPEPETYAMMLAGLGLLGLAARRRRQVAK